MGAMPVQPCEADGRPGYAYGGGKCYTYPPGDETARKEAKRKAHLQGAAIEAAGGKAVGTDLNNSISILPQGIKGLYLVAPHGRLICDGTKTAVVKAKPMPALEGRWVVVSKEDGNGWAFGLAELGPVEELAAEDFKARHAEHQVGEGDRLRWWQEADPLYLYPVRGFKGFERPVKVVVPPGTQTVMRSVEPFGLTDTKGGPGSGHRGHEGRPGQVGGSKPSGVSGGGGAAGGFRVDALDAGMDDEDYSLIWEQVNTWEGSRKKIGRDAIWNLHAGDTLLVARDGEEIVGVAAYGGTFDAEELHLDGDDTYGWLSYLATKRSGYGRKMMAEIIAAMQEEGHGIALTPSLAATGFYEKLGMPRGGYGYFYLGPDDELETKGIKAVDDEPENGVFVESGPKPAGKGSKEREKALTAGAATVCPVCSADVGPITEGGVVCPECGARLRAGTLGGNREGVSYDDKSYSDKAYDGVYLLMFLEDADAAAIAGQVAESGIEGAEPAENLHVTVASLGEMDAQRLALARGALWAQAQVLPPIEGQLGGVGKFGKPGDEEAPFYAVYDAPWLDAFRGRLLAALAAMGIEPAGEHGYSPHVTLAYAPYDSPLPALRGRKLRLRMLSLSVDGDTHDYKLEGKAGEKGGPGSGHWAHEGRPGFVGGSKPGRGLAYLGLGSGSTLVQRRSASDAKRGVTGGGGGTVTPKLPKKRLGRHPTTEVITTGVSPRLQKILDKRIDKMPDWAMANIKTVIADPGGSYDFEAGGKKFTAGGDYTSYLDRIRLYEVNDENYSGGWGSYSLNRILSHEVGHGLYDRFLLDSKLELAGLAGNQPANWIGHSSARGAYVKPQFYAEAMKIAPLAVMRGRMHHALSKGQDGVTSYSKAWNKMTETFAELFKFRHTKNRDAAQKAADNNNASGLGEVFNEIWDYYEAAAKA